MLDTLKSLPEDPAELQGLVTLLAAEVKSQALMIERLQHQLHGANRHRFGSKSESMEQLQLFQENTEIAVAAEEPIPAEPTEAEAKNKPKRKPLPDHLDRRQQVLSAGLDCNKCGGDLKVLGEDITEELEYVPGRFVVNQIIRPRAACTRCEAIQQAPMPSRPIERGRPGPGLLAHVLVSKYADHLPLYRQSQIYGREGVDLDRSTMADWVGKSTALLEPLADAIGKHVRDGQALFADDTPVKMLAPGNKKTQTARVWAYVRDESDHGVDWPRPARGISLQWTEKASIPSATFPATRAGSMRMAMRASTVCLAQIKPMRWPAWHISGASLSMCSQLKVRPLPRRPSSASPSFMPSRKRPVVNARRDASPCARRRLNPSSMIWKHGCMPSFPRYPVNLHWPKPFAMPSTECQKPGPISTTVFWNWTITLQNAP